VEWLIVIAWDEVKRQRTLKERGLDFADAGRIFAGRHFTRRIDRISRGETRFLTGGSLGGRFVLLVWTERNDALLIMSMRYSHDTEKDYFQNELG